MKPGFKSTEFWMTLVGVCSGIIMSVAPDNVYTQAIGAILAAVLGSSYSLGRAHAKGKESHARIISSAMAKKKT